MGRKKTQEEFVKKVALKLPGIKITGIYTDSKTRIGAHCEICGYDWSPFAGSLIAGHGCPVCEGAGQVDEAGFRIKLAATRNDVELAGPYLGSTKKTWFRFLACGHVCPMTPPKITSSLRGCPECAKQKRGASQRLSLDDYEKVMKAIDPNLRLTTGAIYTNNRTPVNLHCDSCGEDIQLSLKQLQRSNGCPNCHNQSTSFLEQFIRHSFILALGEDAVLSRDKTTIGMELDVVVPSLGFSIEPGSWFFHEKNLARDFKKKEACEKKGIRLVTVFDHYPAGKDAPFKDCLVSTLDLSSRKNQSKLQDVVGSLFKDAGIPLSFTENDWKVIEQRALADSRRMTTEDFVKELAGINPNIEFCDTYTKALDKKKFRCRICGYEWETVPSSVRLGSGCQRCSGKLKIVLEEFVRRLAEINPTIELVDESSFSSIKVSTLFRCKKCGYEWPTQPGHLISSVGRTGCPDCHGRRRWKHDEFVEKLARINPRIRVVGRLISSHDPIDVECLDCGRTWGAWPKGLLKGTGCKSCKMKEAGKKRGRKVLCVDTGDVFTSIAEAARATRTNNCAILNCCKGKTRSAGGKRWRYLTDSQNTDD
jgi:hypothetical protein